MDIDPTEIDAIKDPKERADFITWLKNLTDYALKSFGMAEAPSAPPKDSPDDPPPNEPPTVPPPDPVGDVIILNHKQQQLKAMTRRRESGWTSVSLPAKVDDRHI